MQARVSEQQELINSMFAARQWKVASALISGFVVPLASLSTKILSLDNLHTVKGAFRKVLKLKIKIYLPVILLYYLLFVINIFSFYL